jgi:hypothetical protein
MNRFCSIAALALVTTLAAAGSQPAFAQGSPAGAKENPIDPAAVKRLKEMGDYLRSLTSFQIRAETTRDEVYEDGQKIQVGGKYDLTVRRPNGLVASIATDQSKRQIFFDGKTVTVFAPALGYYGSFPAEGTIAQMIEKAKAEKNIDLPLADLFYWGTVQANDKDIQAAQVVVEDESALAPGCQHLAFQQADVDWQIWIKEGAQPLPCRLVITTKTDAARPEFSATFDWSTDVAVSDDTFTFKPPPKSAQIEIRRSVADAGQK